MSADLADLVVLVGDHAIRAPRAMTSPLVRLAVALNVERPALVGAGVVVDDLSGPAGSREVVRAAIGALVRRGPVASRYGRAVLVVSLSVGDLRSGGLHPQDWHAQVVALIRTARALGHAVALLHVAYPEGEANKDARRWSRRLGPEIARLAAEERLLGVVQVEARGWPDPLDPGDAGAETIVHGILRLLDGSPPREAEPGPQVTVRPRRSA
jgi:hypothetical protein